MHKNEDGSVSFSAEEARHLSRVLSLAEELATQMEGEEDTWSEKCEDKLLGYLWELRKLGVSGPKITLL